MSVVASHPLGPQSTMAEVLEQFPGAQRALFRRYHIGGCSQCAFRMDETLGEVCARNGSLDAKEVLDQIHASHQEDARVWISPRELADWVRRDSEVRLVDIRSREEFEAVNISGSQLLSQEVMKEIMGEGTNTRPLVVIDHQGSQGLDAAAYFMGHGIREVRCLRGGIDAWAAEVDSTMRRYRLA